MPDGKGEIAFSVFYVPIFRARSQWETSEPGEGDIVFLYKKHKQKIHVDIKKSPREIIRAIRNFDLSLIGNLDVKNVEFKMHYGSKDAFLTMALLSSARILFYSAMSALKSNQQVEISEEFLPLYNNPALKLEFCGIFCLSIADIIYGYVVGKLRRLRRQFDAYRKKRQLLKNQRAHLKASGGLSKKDS